MSNSAAWIPSSKANPLTVSPAPTPTPEPDEVVIRTAAVAINPVDWKIQDSGFFVKTYPNILGTDVAGKITALGASAPPHLSLNQRVIAHTIGLATGEAKHGAFQLYATAKSVLVSPIPDNMSFTDATVLPLALSTAAAGLFQKTHLALPYPSKDAVQSGKTILIWGGSSSVGATAIQLARGAGVTVVTTASERNFEFVRSLGAADVFDHTKARVVDSIVTNLKGTEFLGAYDSISLPATVMACAEVVSQLGGGMVATVLPPPEGLPENVTARNLFAPSVALDQREVGEAVWGDYVPEALADGRLLAKPDAIVIGKGLEVLQEGLNRQKAGVSAGKIVVDLQ